LPKLSIPLLLSLILACSSPQVDTLDKIKESGKFLIGTDATYPPFESQDLQSGEVAGFDIDLMKAICQKLGVQPEFIVVPFDGIIPGLNNHKYDAIISAFTITVAREEVIDFTDPYYVAGQVIAVPLRDTVIKEMTDLEGKRIGAQLGTTGEMLAKQITRGEVISFDNISAAFIDMENGKLDAIINDKPTSQMIIKVRRSAKIVGPLLTKESYGIAVRQGDKRLLEALNMALQQFREEGVLEELNRRWITSPGGK
jgi:polar amino acid transport system substrate-binding protein